MRQVPNEEELGVLLYNFASSMVFFDYQAKTNYYPVCYKDVELILR
jgi:hypothetical protein